MPDRNVAQCPVCGGTDHAFCNRDKEKAYRLLVAENEGLARKAQMFRDYADSADRQCAAEKRRADEAEAALANRPIQYEPIPVDESADELVFVLKERNDLKAKLAAAEAALYYDEDGDTAQTWQTRAEVLEAKLAAAEAQVERLKALVSYLDDADDHNGMLIMQFEDAEEDAQ